jgi:pimeloyl-ACP methyl ester carboxylesterase
MMAATAAASLAMHAFLAWGVPPPPPERLIDEGTFAVTIAGRRAGTEHFSLIRVGAGHEIRTSSQIAYAGVITTVKGRLQTDEAWRPVGAQYDWRAAGVTRRVVLSLADGAPELAVGAGRSVVYTRPHKASDLVILRAPNVLGQLLPLCRMVGRKEQTLTAFPAAALRFGAAATRPFPQNKLGTPALSLTTFAVTLAQTARYELVCDGPKLVAARVGGQALVAVRASYEAVASALEARARSKPPLPPTLADLERRVAVPAAGGSARALLDCGLMLPRGHADLRRDRKGKVVGTASPVKVGGLTYTPELPASLPAILLLGDAGPQDRDGDPVGPGDPKLSIAKRLAIRLAEAGIASLRCDDRDARAATAPRPTLDALASDARAMLAALAHEAAVDAGRLAVVGHGEGGLVAALAAQKAPHVRALVLLATPGRPLDELVLTEDEQSMRRFGYPEDEVRRELAAQHDLWDAVRAAKPLPEAMPPSERKGVRDALAWMKSHLAHPPAAELARLPAMPVLVAHGARDVQVPIEDAEPVRAGLARVADRAITVKRYPDLNHAFAATSIGGIADYADPVADVAEPFLDDVVAFTKQALGARPVVAN